MTDTSSPTHTFKLNTLKESERMPMAGGVEVLGLEENSDEGSIKPNGSDWLLTDSISPPLGGSESQQTSRSVTRQLRPLDRILRWSDPVTG